MIETGEPSAIPTTGLPASPSTSGDVEDLLAPALEGLGIPHFERGSAAGQIAAARVYATRCVAGQLGPRELAELMHRTFQHGQNDMLEKFLGLDVIGSRPGDDGDRSCTAAVPARACGGLGTRLLKVSERPGTEKALLTRGTLQRAQRRGPKGTALEPGRPAPDRRFAPPPRVNPGDLSVRP